MKNAPMILALLFLGCTSDKKMDYLDLISENDVKMGKPNPGEWLYEHQEKGQTLSQFKRSKPIVPTDGKNTIYLQPIGKFTELQRKQIALVKEYLQAFYQLKVKITGDISDDVVPANARRMQFKGHEQLLAGYLLDSVMVPRKPADAVVFMGISAADLYPKPEWNYVFGLASYKDQVGVTSIYRLQDGQLTTANFNLCLARLLKVCSHEIGHMFGLRHCIDADCVMNGTNHLEETDAHTTRLCSNCQRKIHHTLQYDPKKRLAELMDFFQTNDLKKENESVKKDRESLK